MQETTAKVSKLIDAPPEKIWEALTTPKLIKQYFFGSDVESTWKPGSPIHFRGEYNGKHYEDKGEIQAFKPGRQLSYSHWSPLSGVPDTSENYHLVVFDLEPKGEATKVTITQANLKGGIKESDIRQRSEFEKNWAMVLDGLEKVIAP